MEKFTDLSVRSMPPGTHYDARTPGFGIRIGKNRKTWIVLKGPRANRTQTILGHYPSLSLQDARRKALVALGSPDAPQKDISFPDALAEFLAQDRWRLRSKLVLESSLRHFKWTRPLEKISHEDVHQAIQGIEAKSAKAHALKDIRTFFNWCVPRYLPASPAAGLKMAPQKARDRVLTDEELKRVWIAAETMGYPFGIIVQCLILTGQRKSEIGSLRWEWIKEDRVSLPANVTKNGREHSFPIGSLVSSILKSLAGSTNATSLFLAHPRTNGLYNGYAFHLKQLQKLSGTSDWTLHDLRRTFATGLAALGVPIHVTEKLLNHVSGTTGGLVGVYNKFTYWDEQVTALEKWETRVLSLVRPV